MGEKNEVVVAGKKISHEEMISEQVIFQLDALLKMYMPKILKAMKTNDSQISVSLKVDLSGTDPVDIDTSITFTPERIKDSVTGKVIFDQQNMFKEEKEEVL